MLPKTTRTALVLLVVPGPMVQHGMKWICVKQVPGRWYVLRKHFARRLASRGLKERLVLYT
jgi:hypothetical protein